MVGKILYLCVHRNGYCHTVYTRRYDAQRWCNAHPGYHVIEREVNP